MSFLPGTLWLGINVGESSSKDLCIFLYVNFHCIDVYARKTKFVRAVGRD